MRGFLLIAAFIATAYAAVLETRATPSIYPKHYCTPHVVTAWEQAQIFDSYVSEFYIKKNLTKAYGDYVTDKYIQHNPFVGQGPAASIEFLSPIWPLINLTILHLSLSESFGWVHYRADGLYPEPTALVDIVRFNGSCVVEHWDVIEQRPANATNPLALF